MSLMDMFTETYIEAPTASLRTLSTLPTGWYIGKLDGLSIIYPDGERDTASVTQFMGFIKLETESKNYQFSLELNPNSNTQRARLGSSFTKALKINRDELIAMAEIGKISTYVKAHVSRYIMVDMRSVTDRHVYDLVSTRQQIRKSRQMVIIEEGMESVFDYAVANSIRVSDRVDAFQPLMESK